MLNTFLKYLQYEKRYSQHTVGAYHNDLLQFESFLIETNTEKRLAEADHSLVRSWIVSLVGQGLGPRSINRKISSLRSFYKFLLKREMVDKDPTTKIKLLKTSKILPQFVQEKEMMGIDGVMVFEDGFAGNRDRLIMELLYGTGIRLSELVSLKEEAIDQQQRTLKVLGKRNKERVVPYPIECGTAITHYLREKKRHFDNNRSDHLIVTDKGETCYPMFIYRTVKKYLNQITTIEKRSPHVLRHTYATHLLNKGADLNAVKDLLGHTSLAATQVYTHTSMEKLKSVFDQAHPKA